LRIGTATAAYLQSPGAIDADARARMRFLRWNGTGFDDVSADVVAGRVAADLRVP